MLLYFIVTLSFLPKSPNQNHITWADSFKAILLEDNDF